MDNEVGGTSRGDPVEGKALKRLGVSSSSASSAMPSKQRLAGPLAEDANRIPRLATAAVGEDAAGEQGTNDSVGVGCELCKIKRFAHSSAGSKHRPPGEFPVKRRTPGQ